MYKEQIGTFLSISLLKPPVSFSPFMQEPFCLNCILSSSDASSASIRKWANPSLWHFRQKERINSALCTLKSKTTVQVLLQVYQHLHIPRLLLAGKHKPAVSPTNTSTLGNETTRDQLDPNALTSFPELHPSQLHQTAGETGRWCSSPREGTPLLWSLKHWLEFLYVRSFYHSASINSEGHWYPSSSVPFLTMFTAYALG